jgi:hypothetical protein
MRAVTDTLESPRRAGAKPGHPIGCGGILRPVEQAVTGFVGAVNDMPGITTTEREDAATAVLLLAALAAVPVTEEQALGWFEALRDF